MQKERKHLADGFYRSSNHYHDRPALSIDGKDTSYGNLAQAAQNIAYTLTSNHSITSTRLTAIFGHRSLLAYSGIMGALFAGHGYVPLNPDFPVNRLRSMLKRSKCQFLIVDDNALPLLTELLAETDTTMVIILPSKEAVYEHQDRHPGLHFYSATDLYKAPNTPPKHLNDIAYLLFTSGSTGIPKGVMVSHENVCHFIDSVQQRYQLTPADRVSQTFALTFDLSVFDLFLAWGAGACVCVPRSNELIKPGNYINRENLTLWFSVPSTALFMKKFGELKADKYPTLKWSLFCGEALSEEIAEHWSLAAPNSQLENLYGPTELTIACTVYHRDRNKVNSTSGIVPIGEPLPGMVAKVVDHNLLEVPVGKQGELILTGPQLTLGYLDDIEKTNKAFVHIPNHEEIFYRTGDSAIRKSANQPLEYIGRLDNQIQVNGYRVELGELETVIRSNKEIDEAIAIGWPKTASGFGGIVVFLLGNNVDSKQLIADLRKQLPTYMIPSGVKMVERYPLNSNGKIDRNALLATLEKNR